ncbi:uncharacterized protein LOC125237297 [Leguminivora glycinivorella]|uniref:uncharacterized protein LOC125237297 n=1 Tax=Leguminivora glycinivorella TaxID=1035111 RepID=UPI00200DC344|nr:uncharacterized protein LOC125237297 [Leguminivora glycinivorella]
MPIGSVECFRAGSDWDAYVRRVKQFIALNAIEDKLHVASLVTLVGAECYELMCDLCAPSKPEDKTFDELVKLVREHLEPERSEIAERHIFRQRKQLHGESIREYLQNLKHLAKTCNFGTGLEVNIRDQFVSGLLSEEMRSRLFAVRAIDYKRAVELALALEAAEKHASVSTSAGASTSASAPPDDGLHRVGAARRRSAGPAAAATAAPRAPCARCGKTGHAEGRCRYKHFSCDACGEKGHLKVMCRKEVSKKSAKGEDSMAETLKQEFPEVFAGGLGTFKSRLQLRLKDDTPVFVKARPLPLALRERVEQELDRLQREGVIYKVERSEYGTPIVPVVKASGAILLAHYNPSLPLILSVDSSPYGLGAVLTQKGADGVERPLCCASRTLNAAECNYSQLDKEALAIVFGVTKHHQYVYGRKFTLRTDHRALSYIFGKNKGAV